jgi:hypothetical protein
MLGSNPSADPGVGSEGRVVVHRRRAPSFNFTFNPHAINPTVPLESTSIRNPIPLA